MKRRSLCCALLVLAPLLSACSGITASSNFAPGVNTTQYRTFGWYATPPGQALSVSDQQVRAALQNQLEQKGLTPATAAAPPDFLIAYHAKRQQKVDVSPGYAYGYGYGYGWWGGFPNVYTYTEGTLIVDFIDPKTNQVFWRGTAQSVLSHPNNPDPRKVDKAVAKIIKRYPSQLASIPRTRM